ncbi:MAG: transglycosylase domain-containing protein, partial [Lachnospiraceae bacterium]
MNLGRKGTHKELEVTLSDKPRRRTRRLFRFGMLIVAGIVLLGCLGGSMAYGMFKGILDDAPQITTRDIIPTKEMSFIYDADGNLMDTLIQAGSNRTNVKDYDTIPKDLINAFVAVEDSRFWEHNGIDMKGILRAVVLGVASGFKNQQGASTITQQLIKNNVFTDWTSEESLGDKLERKIQEQYLALQLEKNTSKKVILLNYLNTINLGNSTLGIAQASKRYYGKNYTDLTLSESAVI